MSRKKYDVVVSTRITRADKRYLQKLGKPSEILRKLIEEFIKAMKRTKIQKRARYYRKK